MKKLSWNQSPEITNLDTALVSLGFSYHIGEIPGIEGKVYIIDNYERLKEGEMFAIKEDKFLSTEDRFYYRLYKVTSRWEENFSGLNSLINSLKHALDFYSKV
jgi:hypothetical protein